MLDPGRYVTNIICLRYLGIKIFDCGLRCLWHREYKIYGGK